MIPHHRKAIYLATLVCIGCVASGIHAQERQPAAVAFSEGTKEFLSDPARTGSLVGSILAGAAVANPLAPLLGSVAGFMIGKSSAFTNNDSNIARRNAYLNRSLISEDSPQITSLAGLTDMQPDPSDTPEQTIILGLADEIGKTGPSEQPDQLPVVGLAMKKEKGYQSERSEQIIIVGLPEETGMESQPAQTVSLGLAEETVMDSSVQRNLARSCSNVQFTQPMPLSCYYLSR